MDLMFIKRITRLLYILLFTVAYSGEVSAFFKSEESDTVKLISEINQSNAEEIAKAYRSNGGVVNHDFLVQASNNIFFEKYHFKKNFTATLIEFIDATTFKLSQFDENTFFQSTIFRQSTSFEWSVFNGEVNFSHSRFYGTVNFYRSTFYGDTISFYGANFYEVTDFSDALWAGKVDLSNMTVSDQISFYGDQFQKNVTFYNSHFEGDVDLSYVVFNKNVDFSRASFSGTLDFSGAQFVGKTNFYSTKLPQVLNLSGVHQIDSIIDLTKATSRAYGDKIKINLLGANISKIRINYQDFVLYFPLNTSDKDITTVYAALLNDFSHRGLHEDYKKLAIEQKRYEFNKNDQWMMNIIEHYWWDYGFDKGRIFIWITIFILLYTVINNFFVIWLMENVFSVTFLMPLCKRMPVHKNILVRYVLSFPLSLIYTVVIFFSGILGFKCEFTYFKSDRVLVNIYIFFTMATGLICAMFILNYLIK
jgi:uncharacterized protein YjbI with pentapeptide repeats